MRRVLSAAALSGMLAALGGHGVAAAEAAQQAPAAATPAEAPQAAAAAQAAAPQAPAQPAPAPEGPAAEAPEEAAAAPAPAGKIPCPGGVPPWVAGTAGGPYGAGPMGPYGGPWSRPMPPHPSLPAWEEPKTGPVTVETDADKANYYVIVRLAGMDADDVQVAVRRRGLVVSSGLGWERRAFGPGAWEREMTHQYFREYLSLPWDADVSKMRREVENGTLRIVIPRRGG